MSVDPLVPPPVLEPADPALIEDLARVFERHAARDWAAVVRIGRRIDGPLGGIGLDHARFAVLKAVSFAAGELAQVDIALESADAMVRLAGRLTDDPGAPPEAAVALALSLHRLGDTDAAWSLLDTAASLPDVPHRVRMRALNTLAALLLIDVQHSRDLDPADALQARLDRARRASEQAWALAAELEDDRHRAATLVNVGAALTYLGRREEGTRLLDRAWAMAGGTTAWPHLHLLAEASLLDGRPWAALDRCREAIAAESDTTPAHTCERTREVAWRAARELGLHEEALAHLTTLERLRRGQVLRRRSALSRLATRRHDALAAFDHVHRERLLAHEAARRAVIPPPPAGDARPAIAPQVAGVLADQVARHRPSLVAVVSFASAATGMGTGTGPGWTPAHREVLLRELGRTCRTTDRLLPHRTHGVALVYVGIEAWHAPLVRARIGDAVRRAAEALDDPALPDAVEVGLAATPPANALRRAERNLRAQRQGGPPAALDEADVDDGSSPDESGDETGLLDATTPAGERRPAAAGAAAGAAATVPSAP